MLVKMHLLLEMKKTALIFCWREEWNIKNFLSFCSSACSRLSLTLWLWINKVRGLKVIQLFSRIEAQRVNKTKASCEVSLRPNKDLKREFCPFFWLPSFTLRADQPAGKRCVRWGAQTTGLEERRGLVWSLDPDHDPHRNKKFNSFKSLIKKV